MNRLKKIILVPFILLSMLIISIFSCPILFIRLVQMNISPYYKDRYICNFGETFKVTVFTMPYKWITDHLWRIRY